MLRRECLSLLPRGNSGKGRSLPSNKENTAAAATTKNPKPKNLCFLEKEFLKCSGESSNNSSESRFQSRRCF